MIICNSWLVMNQLVIERSEKTPKITLNKALADDIVDNDQTFRTKNIRLHELDAKYGDIDYIRDWQYKDVLSSDELEYIHLLGLAEKNDKELQKILEKILDENNGLPVDCEDSFYVINALWLIAQHARNNPSLQFRMMEAMYNVGVENVGLVYLYYLCDSITFSRYGYQYFGTQNDGEHCVKLDVNLLDDSSIFTQAAKGELSYHIPANNNNVKELWEYAEKYDDVVTYQDSNIERMIENFAE
jgi:hypothetical protein